MLLESLFYLIYYYYSDKFDNPIQFDYIQIDLD